ncbi:hypothetical protein ACQJBY_013065 [Aegilops geniculata]
MSSRSISSDREMLMEEIISLRRERKDLMESLTPKISCWRDQRSGETVSSFHKMDSSTIKPASSFQSDSQQQQVYLTDDFDILEDVEDLGQRMLSLAHSLSTSHAPFSLYKADELVSTASKLETISLDFYNSTEAALAMEEEAAEGERDRTRKTKQTQEKKMRNDDELSKLFLSHEFLQLSSNVLDRPYRYKNELAMLFTVEEEEEYERVREAEREAERQRMMSKQRRQREKSKQQIVVKKERANKQETKSSADQLKEGLDYELGFFADYRRVWGYSNGSKAGRCGGFEDKTTLSPLQFTHCTPGIIPPLAAAIESTLQIYSFKIVGLKEQLAWPIFVYGVVAARDSVDRNRNLLFSRSRIMGQVLTEDDPYLCLTGPSRAIVAGDYVDFEVELKVRGPDDELKDHQLMCAVNRYVEAVDNGEHRPLHFDSPVCTAELWFQRLPGTVQATILSVRFIGEEFPFKFGGRVACVIGGAREKVVLFESFGEKSEEDEVALDGYVPLSRNVVSVEIGGGLDVVLEAYEEGSNSTSGHFYFSTEYCNTSQLRCSVSGCEVEITVAWSRIVRDKMEMLLEGYATQV